MIYLELFFAFLCIGSVSFGGGYAMISLMKDTALLHGWCTEEELINMIAVAESTPGPIAVNMATFIGSSQAGVLGALTATLGVVLPSFIVILLISAVFRNFLKYKAVSAMLSGIRPAIPALIIGTGVTMLISVLFGIKSYTDTPTADLSGIIIFALICAIAPIIKRITKKKASPIVLILISAGLGIAVYYLAELLKA